MIKCTPKLSLAAGVCFASLVYAAFDVAHWRWRLPLTVAAGESDAVLTVNSEIYRKSASRLDDLRIARGQTEVPYTLKALTGDLRLKERDVSIRDKGWTQGVGLRAILDLGDHTPHNRLRVVTTEHNFKETVLLETSDDAEHWSTVLANGIIFDISRPDREVSDLVLSYPTSTRPFVRLTIPGWRDPDELRSVWVAEYENTQATRDVLGRFKPAVTENRDAQVTALVYDLGMVGEPCDQLTLEVGPGMFSRSIEISAGDDGENYLTQGGEVISRTSDGEKLIVNWSETWNRYIRLEIFNGDSTPLSFGAATAYQIRRVVRFPYEGLGPYWVYLGNASAAKPSYDFGRVDNSSVAAAQATVGLAEANGEFRALQPPVSERMPWVLNVALIVAVVVMGFVTWRFARKTSGSRV